MKVSHFKLRNTLVLLSFAISSISSAQDKVEEPRLTEEIEVVRPYKPVLADAVKIRRNPNLNEDQLFKVEQNYIIPDKRLELNADIKQLQAQQLNTMPNTILKNNYFKVGAGNLNAGLGELYLNTGNDPALQAGLFIKHVSQEGDLNKQKFTTQQIGIFGRSILDRVTLSGDIGYNRRSTYFYAFDSANPTANPDPSKQRYDLLKLSGDFLKNQKAGTNNINYAAKGEIYFLNNVSGAKENSIALSGLLSKTFNHIQFGINSSIDFTTNKDSLNDAGNNILKANPYVSLKGKGYELNVGLTVTNEFGGNSRTSVLPDFTAELNIIPKYALLFAGFTGDVLKTSLRQLSLENPYLNSNQSIRNAVEKVNIYAGIKGNAGSGFGYKVSAYYRNVRDLPLLVNSINGIRKFDIIYDGGDSEIIGLEGEVSVNTSETFSWTGKLLINNYSLATETSAWSKPDFQLLSAARLSVNKKLIVHGQVLLNGETKAKTYTYSPLPVANSIILNSFVDLSLGAEYSFADKIGLYIQINNLLNANYQQYLYYPRLGLNMLAGFNYSF